MKIGRLQKTTNKEEKRREEKRKAFEGENK